MLKNRYKNMLIPEDLYKELKKYVEQSNGSYISISEVVREALREYLKTL